MIILYQNIFYKIRAADFFLLFLFLIVFEVQAQIRRNPVLEYATGTWCQWCPCGHQIIENKIIKDYPNTIAAAYHGPSNGTDIYSYFTGNEIIDQLHFTGYPTGIVDRTSTPLPAERWVIDIQARAITRPLFDLTFNKKFNPNDNSLALFISATALENLSGKFLINVLLLEDSLTAPQNGNNTCIGGSGYVHNNVVRSIEIFDQLLTDGDVQKGERFYIDKSIILPSLYDVNKLYAAAFVYKDNQNKSLAEIQQGDKWKILQQSNFSLEFSIENNIAENTNTFKWKFFSDEQPYMFVVEASNEDNLYFPIKHISSAGNGNYKAEGLNLYLFYRLRIIDSLNSSHYSSSVKSFNKDEDYYDRLYTYPNPFNFETNIQYDIVKPGYAQIKIYDNLGRLISTPVSESKEAGRYIFDFSGVRFHSGVYFIYFQTGDYSSTKKILLLK